MFCLEYLHHDLELLSFLEPSDGACSSLTFGQSSTNNLKVFDGMLFMCTHLCRNKSVDRIMSKTSIQDTDDTQGNLALKSMILFSACSTKMVLYVIFLQ